VLRVEVLPRHPRDVVRADGLDLRLVRGEVVGREVVEHQVGQGAGDLEGGLEPAGKPLISRSLAKASSVGRRGPGAGDVGQLLDQLDQRLLVTPVWTDATASNGPGPCRKANPERAP
jgi:hypothetical protein